MACFSDLASEAVAAIVNYIEEPVLKMWQNMKKVPRSHYYDDNNSNLALALLYNGVCYD